MINVQQQEIIDTFSSKPILKEAFKYYMAHNTALCHPYHNVNHMLSMAYIIDTCIHDSTLPNFGLGMSGKNALLLCVIFHDFNHSGGLFADETNVDNAIVAFRDFVNEWNASLPEVQNEPANGLFGRIQNLISKSKTVRHADYITDEQFNELANIIRSTQYPYLQPTEELSNASCVIIREADLMVAFTSDYFTQCLCGLKSELRLNDMRNAMEKHNTFINEKMEGIKNETFRRLSQDYLDEFNDNYEMFKVALE